jgi:hypothetical protein
LSAGLLILAVVVGVDRWPGLDDGAEGPWPPPPDLADAAAADPPAADLADLDRWMREADVPLGRIFGWLERSAAPGVVLQRVDLQSGSRTVQIEVLVPAPAQVESYRQALSAASGPDAIWSLKSMRAIGPGDRFTAQLEGRLR